MEAEAVGQAVNLQILKVQAGVNPHRKAPARGVGIRIKEVEGEGTNNLQAITELQAKVVDILEVSNRQQITAHHLQANHMARPQQHPRRVNRMVRLQQRPLPANRMVRQAISTEHLLVETEMPGGVVGNNSRLVLILWLKIN